MSKSVWAANSRYYVEGKSQSIPLKTFSEADTDVLADEVKANSGVVDYSFFDENIAKFANANHHRLAYLKDEAFSFVRHASEKYKEENIVISFSGGKDSTVTADVVIKALSNPSLVHIFGNTTLEFPSTIEYAYRYRDSHPLAIFQIAKNDEQVFYDVCDDIPIILSPVSINNRIGVGTLKRPKVHIIIVVIGLILWRSSFLPVYCSIIRICTCAIHPVPINIANC